MVLLKFFLVFNPFNNDRYHLNSVLNKPYLLFDDFLSGRDNKAAKHRVPGLNLKHDISWCWPILPGKVVIREKGLDSLCEEGDDVLFVLML